MEELRDLDVRCVIVSGGNPFIEPERLFARVAELREVKPGVPIMVRCNGGCLDRQVVEKIKTLDIRLSFSVFGTSPEEYATVTGVPELYSQLQNAVALCKELGIKYDITLVIPPVARNRYKELHEFGRSLGGVGLYSTELLPRDDKRLKILSSPTGPSRIEAVSTADFFWRQAHNYCLNGKIAIALDGSILPCPSWPESIGTLGSGNGILSILRTCQIDRYWEASKATIPGCETCENRYACVDCALLEWETRRSVSERQRYCSYEPDLGIWREIAEWKQEE
jgi:radical SAM protein with 4Fe4S-binding SPASM domain